MAVVIPFIPYIIAAAGAYASYDQGQKTAKAQEEQQKLNNEATMKSAMNQYSEMSAFEQEANRQNLNDSLDVQADRSRAVGRVNLMTATSGTSGLSMDSLLTDIRQSKGRNMEAINQNRQTDLLNFRSQANSIRYGAARSMDTRTISRPSKVAAGLEVAGAATGAYNEYDAKATQASSVQNSFGGVYNNTAGVQGGV